MAYATLSTGGISWPIISLSVTETAMRGYEWNAQLVGVDAASLNSFGPSSTVSVVLYDDAGQSMSFPPLIALQASCDAQGILSVSGMDQTTWKLSKDVNPDSGEETNSVYNSSTVHTLSAIVSEICSKCGVNLSFSGEAVSMYGLGTLSGNGISLLDRVLGLFNHEWRVNNSGAVVVQPLLWQSAVNAVALPTLSAQRQRDYEQRKTSLAFAKVLSVDSCQEVTVCNGGSTVTANTPLLNPQATGGYPSDRWINPYTMEQCSLFCPTSVTYFNQAVSLGGEYLQCDLVSINDSDVDWHVMLYDGDPGTDDNPRSGTAVGELHGSGSSASDTTSANHPFTHARIFRTSSYQPASGAPSVSYSEYPHVDGIKAVLRCWGEIPQPGRSFTYLYDSEQTPANPDTNTVSDTLWLNLAQCQSLAPGQMWADNRESHTIDYSGPWVLGLHVRDCVSHPVFPSARIDKVTYSISCSSCQVDLQCAVLGSSQW